MYEKYWWTGEDSNLRSSKERQVYSLLPLTARPPVRPIHPQCSHPKRDSHYGGTTSIQGERGLSQLRVEDERIFGGGWKSVHAIGCRLVEMHVRSIMVFENGTRFVWYYGVWRPGGPRVSWRGSVDASRRRQVSNRPQRYNEDNGRRLGLDNKQLVFNEW